MINKIKMVLAVSVFGLVTTITPMTTASANPMESINLMAELAVLAYGSDFCGEVDEHLAMEKLDQIQALNPNDSFDDITALITLMYISIQTEHKLRNLSTRELCTEFHAIQKN